MLKKHQLSAMILGLNDAIVETSGALAGLTLALQNTSLISISGLIIGIAGALSMGASEFLSEIEDGKTNKKSKSLAFLTGISYFLVVMILVIPYFILHNPFQALAVMIFNSLIVVLFYSIYTTKNTKKKYYYKFFRLSSISLSVALLSFTSTYIIKIALGIEL